MVEIEGSRGGTGLTNIWMDNAQLLISDRSLLHAEISVWRFVISCSEYLNPDIVNGCRARYRACMQHGETQ